VSSAAPLAWAEFERVDMRVGRIVAVEDFSEARRPAWKLRVDFGAQLGVRRSSAQIATYPREALEGRLVVGVVNFPAKQIGPVRSECLVLGTYAQDGTVLLLSPEPEAELGDRVG
jgi:tRNA-binding protein